MAFDRLVKFPSAVDAGIYALVQEKGSGQTWNVTAGVVEAWSDANFADYRQATIFTGRNTYGYTVPANLPHGEYVATFYLPTGGVATLADLKLPDEFEFKWTGHVAAAPIVGEPAGQYTNKTFFDLFNGGAKATDVESDGDGDGESDPDILQNAIDAGENFINSRLRGLGFTVPLTGMDAITTRTLRDYANTATRRELAKQLLFAGYAGRTMKDADQRRIADNDTKELEAWFERLYDETEKLTTDGGPVPSGGPQTAIENIPIRQGGYYECF
jgi:hypothetical protein